MAGLFILLREDVKPIFVPIFLLVLPYYHYVIVRYLERQATVTLTNTNAVYSCHLFVAESKFAD
jgi:hypothetical protein